MSAHAPRRNRWWIVLAAFAGSVGLLACGSDPEPGPDAGPDPAPNGDTYAVAIASVLDTDGPPADPLPVVYVVPLDGAIDIEAQAVVIGALADSHDVRFVDELVAAIDIEQPGHPPRDDAIVIALGPIAETPPYQVRLERYHTEADIDAALLTLDYRTGRWVVRATEPVPAEALDDVD